MKAEMNAPFLFAPILAITLASAGVGTSVGSAVAADPAQPAAGAAGIDVTPQPATGAAGNDVTPGNGPIAAPDTVDAGQAVNVVVNGAPLGSRIELWGPVTESGGGGPLSASPIVGGTAQLIAPAVSASYQIRYVSENGAVLARQPFDVAAVPVALTVMTPVEAGGALEVRWQGPAAPGDRFDIAYPFSAALDSTPVAGDPATENLSTLTVPQSATGRLELRYVTGRGDVLRSVPFDIR